MTDAQPGQAGPLIYGVPLALWITAGVAVLAALVSVAVSVWSNWSTRQNVRLQLEESARQAERRMLHDADQLKIQLSHDATQKDRERHMTLRREVYLEAAVALIDLQTILGRVQSLDEDDTALYREFSRGTATLSKVHIVGSQSTVEAVMAYVNQLAPAFIKGLAERMQMMVRKTGLLLVSLTPS